MTRCGIYRDLYIDVKPATYISAVFVTASLSGDIKCEIEISGEIEQDMRILQRISVDGTMQSLADVEAKEKINISSTASGVKPWSIDDPNIYTLRTELWKGNGPLDIREDEIYFCDVDVLRR